MKHGWARLHKGPSAAYSIYTWVSIVPRSLKDRVEHLAAADRVGAAERVVVLGSGGVAQAVEDRGREVLGPDPAFPG